MTFKERLYACDVKTVDFFENIKRLMEKNGLYGWLGMDARALAKRLFVSESYCYTKLEGLRAQGILAKGRRGYYCPNMVGELVQKCGK